MTNFNPLPSHEGRLKADLRRGHPYPHFNPLPSHEGRPGILLHIVLIPDFNPLPSHEGRRCILGVVDEDSTISIHSPHTRGDDFALVQAHVLRISIHSPHTRGDECPPDGAYYLCHFNPLPSHEGRHGALPLSSIENLFQSTPLTRGETSPE